MTLTELRYVVNLEKERHFGRAAERSFVSQPTLSVAIKKLEDELNVVLFERNRGEVAPTPLGARIVAQAQRVLAEAQLIEDLSHSGRDELGGPLRFGAIYTVAPYLLPGLVPTLRERAPLMPLVIEENFTAVLLEQLRAAELDVIAVALPLSQREGFSTWPLYDEDFVVVLPADHALAQEKAIPSKRLAEEKLLLLGSGHCFRDQVIAACPKCLSEDPSQPKPLTGSSLETIRHMVRGGLGITVLPRSSTENRSADPSLVARPMSPAPQRRIGLVWRKSYPRLKAITALRDAVLGSGMAGVEWLKTARAE